MYLFGEEYSISLEEITTNKSLFGLIDSEEKNIKFLK